MNSALEQQIVLGLVQLRAEAGARGAMFDQLLTTFAASQPDPRGWLLEQKASVNDALKRARKEAEDDPSLQVTISQSIVMADASYDAIATTLGSDQMS